MIVSLAVIIVSNIAILNRSHSYEYVEMPIADLHSVVSKLPENQNYYVLYGAENCIYCNLMEETYDEAFRKVSAPYLYYVNLTNESVDSPDVQERNIAKIPLLVIYQNDTELERLEGVATVDEVVALLNK